jgi:hypothetical protein
MPQKYAKNDEKSGFKHRKWFDSIAIINQPSLTIINHHYNHYIVSVRGTSTRWLRNASGRGCSAQPVRRPQRGNGTVTRRTKKRWEKPREPQEMTETHGKNMGKTEETV